jgi:hypothetical protein
MRSESEAKRNLQKAKKLEMAATIQQIIKTGFSTIYWHGEPPHRPSTVIKGQNVTVTQ